MKGKEKRAVFSPLTCGVSLCVITDNDYCVPTIVSLTSAKRNKRRESHYRVHIIQCRVSSFYLHKFRELDAPDFEIIIHDGDIEKYEWVRVKGHVPITAMLKLDMASHLSNEGRTLYIDGDTIIKDDLTDLFYTDLEGVPIAAVRDIGGELKQKYGEKIGVKKYYNAGILLIDLDLFREEKAQAGLLKKQMNAPDEWCCLEQDNLNTYFNGRIKELPFRYNALIPMCLNKFYNYNIEDINAFYGTMYSSMEEAENDAAIIHFAGESWARPWNVICGSYSNIWQHYYDISPIRDQWLKLHIDLASIHSIREEMSALENRAMAYTQKYVWDMHEKWSENSGCLSTRVYKLFSCIPILKIIRDERHTGYYLFCLIPIISFHR